MRLLQGHVHRLFQGEAHLHEPLQGNEGGIRAELRREEEFSQITDIPDFQGQRLPRQDRGHARQPDPRGIL